MINKLDKKLKEINSNSIYKINIDNELKQYEIEILKNSIKKDLHFLIHSQCSHIHYIDFVLNRRINNAVKKLRMIENKLNDLENERTKVIKKKKLKFGKEMIDLESLSLLWKSK